MNLNIYKLKSTECKDNYFREYKSNHSQIDSVKSKIN